MNHPFPGNLPLLRRIYEGRFSAVRFLIPFERMPSEPDVITVYRGSYSHAGYLNDAWPHLKEIDCDYYLVVHDDVLLHPAVSEHTFSEFFPLGPNDGFLPRVQGMPGAFGNWIWYSSFLPKLLHPKSQLFGSGIEFSNLEKYLPDYEYLKTAILSNNATPTEFVRFDREAMDDIARWPSRVLLHGLQGVLPEDDEQAYIDQRCLEIARLLNDVLLDANRERLGEVKDSDGKDLKLPMPIVQSGYLTDFYILPRTGAEDFQHYMGVAAAANLFVEIIAPTLLYACCEKVWTGEQFGHDYSGFDMQKPLGWLTHKRSMAIHPIKLSAYRASETQEAFMDIFASIRDNSSTESAVWNRIGALPPGDAVLNDGWHAMENWGVWSSERESIFRIAMCEPASVVIKLRAPLHPSIGELGGEIRSENGRAWHFNISWPEIDIQLQLDDLAPDPDGMVVLRLVSERLISPAEIMPETDDERMLGIGLVEVAVLSNMLR